MAAFAFACGTAIGIGGASAAYYVIGDSLGVGVSWAAPGSTSLAANSVRITSSTIINQLNSIPQGSLVFMSLGTNDAVGYVVEVTDAVNRIVSTAAARGLRLVWIGPPCVFKDWDSAAAELDGRLAAQLRSSGVTYVSMRAPGICDRAVRAGDGVHFSMTGYQRMWSLAAAAVGLEPATAVPNVPAPLPRPNPIRVANPQLAQQPAAPAAMPATLAAAPALVPAGIPATVIVAPPPPRPRNPG